MYVYITTPNAGKNDNDLHTVGHYAPDGTWIPESDHDTDEQAAARVHWLNGGQNIRSLENRVAILEEAESQRKADENMAFNVALYTPSEK